MSEWKQATKTFQWREPQPNDHEWKYVGRTPQGGLSGGDDVYECQLCHITTDEPSKAWSCQKGSEGKTEKVVTGKHPEYYYDITEKAILGKHIILQDPSCNYPEVIAKTDFKKFFVSVGGKT
jgi:hypothetical protein